MVFACAEAKNRLGSRAEIMPATIVEYELEQIERLNGVGRQPVVFIQSLWLLPCSWDRWIERFEEAGYAALSPGWPDPEMALEVGQVANYYETILRGLRKKPAVIGHSFGGTIAVMLAGRGCSAASTAVAPVPLHGLLSPLTFERFRVTFANAVSEQEARELYECFSVVNLNAEKKDDVEESQNRGPLLVVAAGMDRTVPPVVVKTAAEIEARNSGVTEYVEMPGRGHSLTIDRGWHEVADLTLAFVQRFAPAGVRA
jgi:non-heme chloroperoxidase